jgi:hypothetical protein
MQNTFAHPWKSSSSHSRPHTPIHDPSIPHTHTRTQQHVWKEANKQNNWIKWRVFCLSRCLSTFIFHLVLFFYLKQVHLLDPSEQKTLKGAGVAAKLWISFSNFCCWHLDVIVYSYAVSNLWPDNRNKGIALQTLSLTLSGAAFYFVVSFFFNRQVFSCMCYLIGKDTKRPFSIQIISSRSLYCIRQAPRGLNVATRSRTTETATKAITHAGTRTDDEVALRAPAATRWDE